MAGGKSGVSFQGIPEVKAALAADMAGMTVAVKQALYASLLDIGKAANQLVPVDTGNLRSSQEIQMSPTNLGGSISYGGSAAPYAVIQHENLNLWHPPKPPNKSKVGRRSGSGPVPVGTGRGAKYLEIPFIEETSAFPEKLIKRIRALYKLGGK